MTYYTWKIKRGSNWYFMSGSPMGFRTIEEANEAATNYLLKYPFLEGNERKLVKREVSNWEEIL